MVVTAQEIGFCFGVKRAISIGEKALKKYKTCVSLGPIIHNERVIEKLAASGLKVCDLAEIKGEPVIIRSHGVHPEVRKELEKKSRVVIDATCPFVQGVQNLVAELRKERYTIIIAGKPAHPEVTALAGVAGKQGFIYPVRTEWLQEKKVAVVSQTTSTQQEYRQVVLSLLKLGLPSEIRIFNTVCRVTERRQADARHLAKKVDVLLVVGSKKSANTTNLYRLLRQEKKATYLVSGEKEVQKRWCTPKIKVGLVSGTSTPRETIEEVKERLTQTPLITLQRL
ncbi:MAG: 4-hydroxy-3-methylbut-2-enyl diphosphate reductase [Candidatus Omnitrophota bacterium]